MRDAVIYEPLRTPADGYARRCTTPRRPTSRPPLYEQSSQRTGVPNSRVDEVVLGQCYPNGEAPAIGGIAVFDAGLCVVTHPHLPGKLGLRPLGRLASWAVAGVEPERMGIGPGPRDRHGPRAGGPAARGRRARAAQRARVRALPRPPGRCHRRPHPLPAAPGDGAPRGALRSRDDVHPEWPGHRSRLRARGLTWQHPGPPGSSINAS